MRPQRPEGIDFEMAYNTDRYSEPNFGSTLQDETGSERSLDERTKTRGEANSSEGGRARTRWLSD